MSVFFSKRFTRFVCSALRFIPHEPRKKDTHSLIMHPCRLFDVAVTLCCGIAIFLVLLSTMHILTIPTSVHLLVGVLELLRLRLRLGYCFTPYQRLWLYNGAPLVAFYDTLGIRRTYSRLEPPASSRGLELLAFTSRHRVVLQGNFMFIAHFNFLWMYQYRISTLRVLLF